MPQGFQAHVKIFYKIVLLGDGPEIQDITEHLLLEDPVGIGRTLWTSGALCHLINFCKHTLLSAKVRILGSVLEIL